MNSTEILKLLETRRTYRKFDQSRQISKEAVEDMKKAARTASSAMNRQPLRYLYVRSPQKVNEVFETTKWAGALPSELGVPREGEKPTLYVVVLSVIELQSAYTSFDEGLAVSKTTLAAWTHGVGSCIIGSADKDKLRKALEIDESLDIGCVVAFGYPVHESYIEDMKDDTKYYLDEKMNYHVPKRKICDTVKDV